MKKYIRRAMFSLRIKLGDKPNFFFLIYGLKSYNKELFINNETDMVVNAYPRCGNTFFYYSIKHINPELNLSHHLHVPALTMRSVKLGLPSVVIIRRPIDAIVSLLIREDHITIKQAAKLYINFYSVVDSLSEHVLIFDFKLMIDNFPAVVEKLNNRFALKLNNYKKFEKEDVENIFSSIDLIDKKINGETHASRVSRPVVSKEKQELKEKIKAEIYNSYENEIRKCEELYNKLICN